MNSLAKAISPMIGGKDLGKNEVMLEVGRGRYETPWWLILCDSQGWRNKYVHSLNTRFGHLGRFVAVPLMNFMGSK